jgi:uncharacterized membrane protein YccC
MNRILAISGLDRAAVRQGLLLALAALIAFAIAAALHVHHAYWAAMPVFVVAQPMRGLVFERGLFRLLGTLAGAASACGCCSSRRIPSRCSLCSASGSGSMPA